MTDAVFTPIAYMEGFTPGGLYVVDANTAYIMERGWPSEADATAPGSEAPEVEPFDTWGGYLCKVDLQAKKMVDDSDWPVVAVWEHAESTVGIEQSEKPYLGPFVHGTNVYVLAHGLRERAPWVQAAPPTNGRLYRLVPDPLGGGGTGLLVDDSTTTMLNGPMGAAIDAAGQWIYVVNSRAGTSSFLVRFNADFSVSQSIQISGVTPRQPLAVVYRKEKDSSNNDIDVLYVADHEDEAGYPRGTPPPSPDHRGRILRLVLNGNQATGTIFAKGLDRPIGLAVHSLHATDYKKFEIFALCDWPSNRVETGVETVPGSDSFCLPPWRTFRRPMGSIQRVTPDTTDLTVVGTVKTFCPSLVQPGGIAVHGEVLYVATVAGPPEAPPAANDSANATTMCSTTMLWNWVPPRSGMLYRVKLDL